MKLDIHGQEFDVAPDILNGILNAMSQTAQDGFEHGFRMCQTPQGLVKGEDCTGNECSIQLHGCKGVGPVGGEFHSHPDVISWSLGDYVSALGKASELPEPHYLTCVALKDSGIRCKAVTSLPPNDFMVPMVDNDANRNKVKPFFTKKVSISKKQLQDLVAGTPWEELIPEEEIIAIDEGDVVVPTDLFAGVGQGVNAMPKKSLVEVAQQYINKPSGKYPWETKTVTKSVKGPMGVGLVMAGMPTLESDETQFIPTRDIEIPDPGMLSYPEVGSYIAALSPIILTKEKDANGKWKILDGRHRVAAWRAAGYKQIPVVFSTETEYK